MPAQYALHLSCEALLTDPEDKAQCTAKWGWWWNGVQIEVRKDQQWYFSQPFPFPYPLSRSITILISRRRARVSERMRTRKRWAREGREKGEAGSRCGPFTREWGKRKIEINRLHETHTHTHTCVYGMCVCAHASYEKLRTGLDNDPGSEEVKASRQRQQTQIPPSCGSRWQREALRRALKRVAAYLLIMQDKVPYTHTHTHMHLPCDRICRVHGQKYKKKSLSLLLLIEWTCPKMNWWQQRRKREGAKEKGQCIAANYSTGQGDRQQRKLIFADLDLPVRIWMLWHVKHTAPIT